MFFFIGEPEIKEEFLNPCLNGGYFTKLEKCICLPGFKGQFCETGNLKMISSSSIIVIITFI